MKDHAEKQLAWRSPSFAANQWRCLAAPLGVAPGKHNAVEVARPSFSMRKKQSADVVLVQASHNSNNTTTTNSSTVVDKSCFAKIRQAALEDVRERAFRHALVCGRLHPSKIVATGVATSLYRDYVNTLTVVDSNSSKNTADANDDDVLLAQHPAVTTRAQRSSSLVLSSAAGTGKTCAGILLVNGRSPYAPRKSLYVGGIKSNATPTPTGWYESVRRAILQSNVHDAIDDFQLAKLLGEVFKLEKPPTQENSDPTPPAVACNGLCQSEVVSTNHGTLVFEDGKLVPYLGLEHKIAGLPHRNPDHWNGVLVLDDMNFTLDTSADHAPFQHQMGPAYSFCRSLAEIAVAREFMVVFITNRPHVAQVLAALPGVAPAPASQFSWTPRRRLRLLAKRFPSIEMDTLREFADDIVVGMEDVCATLGKLQLRANLPALACTSTGSI